WRGLAMKIKVARLGGGNGHIPPAGQKEGWGWSFGLKEAAANVVLAVEKMTGEWERGGAPARDPWRRLSQPRTAQGQPTARWVGAGWGSTLKPRSSGP